MAKRTGRMGRPSVAAKDQRTTPAKALVTKEEYAEMQAAAERATLPLSTWLRLVALRAAREESGATGGGKR